MSSVAWGWVERSYFEGSLSLVDPVYEVCEAEEVVREKLAVVGRSRFCFGVPRKIRSAPALLPASLDLTTTSVSNAQMVHKIDLPPHMEYSVFPARLLTPESTVTVSGISRVIGYLHSIR
jgi:hypothetical protein